MPVETAPSTATLADPPPEVDALAERVVRFGLTVPAILFLESMRPMNLIGANALHFMAPVLDPLMPGLGVDELARFLERRDSVEALIRAIEERASATSEERA